MVCFQNLFWLQIMDALFTLQWRLDSVHLNYNWIMIHVWLMTVPYRGFDAVLSVASISDIEYINSIRTQTSLGPYLAETLMTI
jgi:hypothetical protein